MNDKIYSRKSNNVATRDCSHRDTRGPSLLQDESACLSIDRQPRPFGDTQWLFKLMPICMCAYVCMCMCTVSSWNNNLAQEQKIKEALI